MTLREVASQVFTSWQHYWAQVVGTFTDEYLAVQAFVADGGDPAYIQMVEEAYEVCHDGG